MTQRTRLSLVFLALLGLAAAPPVAAMENPPANPSDDAAGPDLGLWSLTEVAGPRGAFRQCELSRRDGGLATTFSRSPEGTALSVSNEAWQLPAGAIYRISLEGEGIETREFSSVSSDHGVLVDLGTDADYVGQLGGLGRLDLRTSQTVIPLPMDGAGEALAALEDCWQRNAASLANPFAPAAAGETPQTGPQAAGGVAPSAKSDDEPSTQPSTGEAKPTAEVTSNAGAGDTQTFTNSRATAVAPALAENYVDFSFDYPADWTIDPETGTAEALNFVTVVRPQAPGGFDTEKFGVGRLSGTGVPELDAALLPQLLTMLETQFGEGFPNFEVVSRDPTTINGIEGQEFRFKSRIEAEDLDIWGRIVALPPPAGTTKGVLLVMLATDQAPEIASENDVGEKGQMPMILRSFKFGA